MLRNRLVFLPLGTYGDTSTSTSPPRRREPFNGVATSLYERATRLLEANPMLRLAEEVLVAQSITTWNNAGDYDDRMQDRCIHDVADRALHIEATQRPNGGLQQ